MASIDAFWDLAASDPAPNQAFRASLRRLRPAASSTTDPETTRQRTLILLGIALLHVLMLLVLRAAMQPPKFARPHEAALLQITFIERQPVLVVAKPIAALPVVPQPRATATPQRFVPRTDALQAVTIAPRTVPARTVAESMVAEPSKTLFYSADGKLLVPAAPSSNPPRDLLAHRSVDWMLPGAARKDSPDFHVRDDPSPQDAVNRVAGIVSGLIGGVAARPSQNGIVSTAPDRGMRTSGRDTDPCEDIVLDMADVDPDDAKVRERAEERYEKSCEGH